MKYASRRGCHSKINSFLQDEDFKLHILQYLCANKFTLTFHSFIKFVEEQTIPALGFETKKKISEVTARKQLHHFDWDYKDHLKNIYFDGHERDDVIVYRNQFLKQIANLRP